MSETAEVHNVPGSVLDCFCPKCENITEHTIVSATKRRVREVRCEACKFAHKFTAMKKTAKQRKTSKPSKPSKPAKPAKPQKAVKEAKTAKPAKRGRRKKLRGDGGGGANEWEMEMEEKKDMAAVDYRLGGSYAEGTVIRHPSFGVGFVKKIISGNKFEALFKGGRKFLVQNIKR